MDKNTAYKQSTVGRIPSDWEVDKLKGKALIKGGYAFDSSKFQKTGHYQVVKMSNLYDNNLDLSRSESFITELEQQEKEYVLKRGDILITLTGTVGKRDYGFSFQIADEGNLVLNQRVAKIEPIDIDAKYLYYEVKTDRFLNQFFYSSRGGTGNQANVGTNDLSDISILCPPLPEQRRIAACLSSWDEAITKTTQLIAQKEQQKKWLMQQLLTGKKRLPGFEKMGVKRYSYEQLLKSVVRPVKWNDEEQYQLISVRRKSGGIFQREPLYGYQIKVKNLRTAKTGDFLFSKMQILHGASALVTKEFDGAKISGSYIAVVAKDPAILNLEYLNWYSQLPYFYHQTYISSYGVTIEKMTFEFEYFLQLGIKLPSIEEQNAIVNILNTADKELQLLKCKAGKLKEEKRWLMQQLLTGKKRLKIENN